MDKLSDQQTNQVVGGNGTVNLNNKNFWDPFQDRYCKKRAEWKSNEVMKAQLREMIAIFDSSSAHNLAIGECPGCGCLVNSIGNVCSECRKQANS